MYLNYSAKALFALVISSAVLSTNGVVIEQSIIKRQIPTADVVTCNFVLQPTAVVDPSAPILGTEFGFAIGQALNHATRTLNFNFGLNFTANHDANNTFNVTNELGAQGSTADQTTAIIEGWVGTTLAGLSSNWIVNDADCHA